MGCCDKPLKTVRGDDPHYKLIYRRGLVMKVHKEDIVSSSISNIDISLSLSNGHILNVKKEDLVNYQELWDEIFEDTKNV